MTLCRLQGFMLIDLCSSRTGRLLAANQTLTIMLSGLQGRGPLAETQIRSDDCYSPILSTFIMCPLMAIHLSLVKYCFPH